MSDPLDHLEKICAPTADEVTAILEENARLQAVAEAAEAFIKAFDSGDVYTCETVIAALRAAGYLKEENKP